jgi:NAD-dependent deacetylase
MAGADDLLAIASMLVAGSQRIVVLSGAGISTESGIPDFRGPNGVWTKNPGAERQSTLQNYLSDADVRKASWRARVSARTLTADPNAGHRAIVELERTGRLLAVVTQNVDELHQKAGTDPALVVELHGTGHRVRCWSCGDEAPMERALERVRAGEEDPPCRACGGILKSATISFGQPLDPEVLAAAQRAVRSCDLLLVVGSSLTVHPAAGLVPVAAAAGAEIVIVNAEPTPYDHLAAACLHERIGEVLPRLIPG